MQLPDIDAIRAGDRTAIGRAITLTESTRADHREMAGQMLESLIPHTGDAHRVGITGVPGVGKSTFIDAFGSLLTGRGHRVAVLAIDPSSSVSGGSILGDKTRMERLATDANAFIRPSPSLGALGGVTRATRESMVVLEAAGYDVVLVETVGVGQSETVVAQMVDFFCVLMLPGAGDELQGIKKGVLELADMIVVNKADANPAGAREAVRDYGAALRLLTPQSAAWNPSVMSISAVTGDGLDSLWDQIDLHRRLTTANGEFDGKRSSQQVAWMWAMIDDRLRDALRSDPRTSALVDEIAAGVGAGSLPATVGADRLLGSFLSGG